MKIQEILLNIAESLEKKLGEQLNLKEEQSQGDKIMKENIQNSQKKYTNYKNEDNEESKKHDEKYEAHKYYLEDKEEATE